MENNWAEFWNKKQDGFDNIMQHTTAYFQKNYIRIFPLEQNDVLLDYGCGPGYFLEKCTSYKNNFAGIDISKNYIRFCKEKFNTYPNFSFYLIEDSNNFSTIQHVISEKKVNKIVCLSVLQYFSDEKAVENFLDMIFSSGKIHATFGDVIPKNSSIIKDTFYVFMGALKNGFIISYVSFILKTLFSDYLKKDKAPLLQFDKDFFINYAKKNNLNISILNLSIPKTRFTVVLSNRD
ncbi:class I SAM-dependent methyltransferase [Chryseobacterium sp. Y16C]|uniref:methyltransferase domain-containing protein n=1 Tax=Chryseobacterium sp. Y16C TaxID=2920939 RepID=UPI001F0AA239|nr:methyltransferase domain-containing protein [Chryseobacterium sp. Y16C]UMQ40270.1 class I SAM-dependent methyltransferase [Chryseobacterium sp. Y16C]